MRLAEFEKDGWRLDSGEERHARWPQTFEIPERVHRDTLPTGASVRLIFQILGLNEDGGDKIETERMWVLVSGKVGDIYLGILSNEPATFWPRDGFHLRLGAEIPFRAEHVIDIDYPAPELTAKALADGPSIMWPRD